MVCQKNNFMEYILNTEQILLATNFIVAYENVVLGLLRTNNSANIELV